MAKDLFADFQKYCTAEQLNQRITFHSRTFPDLYQDILGESLFPTVPPKEHMEIEHGLKEKQQCVPCQKVKDATFRCPTHARLCRCNQQFPNKSTWRTHLNQNSVNQTRSTSIKLDDNFPIDTPWNQIKSLMSNNTREVKEFFAPNSQYWKKRLVATLKNVEDKQKRTDWIFLMHHLKFTAKSFCKKLEKRKYSTVLW